MYCNKNDGTSQKKKKYYFQVFSCIGYFLSKTFKPRLANFASRNFPLPLVTETLGLNQSKEFETIYSK